MIPVRVALAGFLSYAEEQEISFDGAGLWILAGPNGSGKSAVFDALTYSLFGHHRGGAANNENLIHNGLSTLSVEFDFTLAGKLFRIKRTLKKNQKGDTKPTQQAFLHDGAVWKPVPETTKKADLEKWVQEQIGLTYETFTSSVLLLQGEAEKLLNTKPAGRAEVLAGVVDLARFKKLHEAAGNAVKLLVRNQDQYDVAVKGYADVTSETIAIAKLNENEAEEKSQTARAQIEVLAERERRARLWADTHARHLAAQTALAHAESLLAGGKAIEAAATRLQELRTVLPIVQTVVLEKAKVAESEKRSERYLKEREEEQRRQQEAARQAELARAKKFAAREQLAKDDAQHAIVQTQLRERTAALEQVKLAEQHAAALESAKTNLAKLPADANARATAARLEWERLKDLQRLLPVFTRIHTERADALTTRAVLSDTIKKLEQLKTKGEEAKALHAKQVALVELQEQERAKAQTVAAASGALQKQAYALAQEFRTLSGQGNCRTCGQALTPAHFEDELARRDAYVKATETQAKTDEAFAARMIALEGEARATLSAQTTVLQHLRDQYQETQAEIVRAKKDTDRHTKYVQEATLQLPEPWRTKVHSESFPSAIDLQQLQKDVDKLPLAERAVQEADATRDQFTRLTAEVYTHAVSYTRLTRNLPADPSRVRQEHEDLRTSEVALSHAVKACRLAGEAAEREEDKARQTAHTVTITLTDLVGKLKHEETTRIQSRELIERTATRLAPEWQLQLEHAATQQYYAWNTELDALVHDGTELKRKELERARGSLATLAAQVAREADALATFTEAERQAPDAVRVELAAVRLASTQAETVYLTMKQNRAKLEADYKKLATLNDERKALQKRIATMENVVKYLGRDFLQRYLVRTAERQIVDHANAVLDRLSNGELSLKAIPTDNSTIAEKALDLVVVNRTTNAQPIPVAFLSGSQRFRVAVSLALGIGRYASRQHRPIESVIIDEGFGCLDDVGRQTIIQELHTLRGALERVILVSHQEEIASAIPHGYQFERINGATQVKRKMDEPQQA